MIVYEVGSIIAVKESNGSRILHGFNAIGINGHPSSRSATRLRKKLRRRANKMCEAVARAKTIVPHKAQGYAS
jgi:hypothetical protein